MIHKSPSRSNFHNKPKFCFIKYIHINDAQFKLNMTTTQYGFKAMTFLPDLFHYYHLFHLLHRLEASSSSCFFGVIKVHLQFFFLYKISFPSPKPVLYLSPFSSLNGTNNSFLTGLPSNLFLHILTFSAQATLHLEDCATPVYTLSLALRLLDYLYIKYLISLASSLTLNIR